MLAKISVFASDIKVLVDEYEVQFDVPPIIENGRTLVPMRAIFEALNAEIFWDGESQTAAAILGDVAIAVQVGNSLANVNNEGVVLDVAPKIINGRTLVPLRFIGENFGFKVLWDKDTQTVNIYSGDYTPAPNVEPGFLVGLWSIGEIHGTLVDKATGLPAGSSYSGEWYSFRPDGTFSLLMVGSGTIISGSILQVGEYNYMNGTIELRKIKESWTPAINDPSKRPAYSGKNIDNVYLHYKQNENGEIVIIDNYNNNFRKVIIEN